MATPQVDTIMTEPIVIDRTTKWADLPDLLTPADAAWLGISTWTVYQHLSQKKIPHTRFGKVYRISKMVLLTAVVA